MLLFFLPLLLNPVGLLTKWTPLIYLSSWPLIMENMGRDALTLHALLLILFIVICDLSRKFMLNLIGFDLMSLPAGIGVLFLALTTDKGSLILDLLRPLFSALMYLSEPAFLLIEVYLMTDLVKSFNKWLADKANERDSESRSLAQWEEPLSRSAIVARIAVIFLTLASYLGTYLLIRESRMLVEEADGSLPINFTHAIAVLTSLQLIALSVTIYKDDGVISETAMISLLASLPILFAASSYSSLKTQTTTTKSASFGLFFGEEDEYSTSSGPIALFKSVAGKISSALAQLHQQNNQTHQWIYNAGLLLHKLLQYYSAPQFFAVLFSRLLCLGWWCSGSGYVTTFTIYSGPFAGIRRRWPLSRAASIKILLVLTYAQMLTQQLDNRHQLELWSSESSSGSASSSSTYFSATSTSTEESWFSCMWNKARMCLGQPPGSASKPHQPGEPRSLENLIAEASQQLTSLAGQLLGSLEQLPALVSSLGPIWFARWRSLIIQRLFQSSLVQLAYIGSSLLLSTSD